MMPQEVYTPEEVAAMLKVSKQAIYKWVRQGQLPSIKIGTSVRIPVNAVDRLFTDAGSGLHVDGKTDIKGAPRAVAA